MSPRNLALDGALQTYLDELGGREHPELARLRAATDALADGGMRSSTVQVQLLALLIELIDARRVLEIGCFTGYGSLGMALALPPEGRLTTLDVNDDWPALGQRHWQEAGVARRIDFRQGLAMDSIDDLIAEGASGSFDLVYVDAEKKGYPQYYEAALGLLRAGGLVALDNMLWKGAVADPDDRSRQTLTLRALTREIHGDERVTPVLLPIGDGLLLARKRG
ncbi:MAG: class I SAM-dependent methyltransferase [Geminicoccaceae bacterium]|nr:class I SAM-dependent methyltransferase [Geminicoccaceae bacterium]MCB9968827.1 class I SAM-dependent methyltransferase [Geminicoccaceae bacterium]HRY24348.1 class I SAM-dependent methyltransferase [Geminicoccaceae bacterium]